MHVGEMVEIDGRTARITDINVDRVDAVHVNRNGDLVRLSAHPDDAMPLWLAYSPKSSWPDTNDLDDSILARTARILD